MEQRSGERKAASLDAVVSCARFGLIRGRIVNLAMGGLYVEADTCIVPIGVQVTVTFRSIGGAEGRWLHLKGRVSHQSLEGFGIEFDSPGEDGRRVLQQVLPNLPSAPAKAFPVLRVI